MCGLIESVKDSRKKDSKSQRKNSSGNFVSRYGSDNEESDDEDDDEEDEDGSDGSDNDDDAGFDGERKPAVIQSWWKDSWPQELNSGRDSKWSLAA
jgi:hypothetical protein